MISVETFQKRADNIYYAQVKKHRKRLGVDLPPTDVLPFTRQEFRQWLWKLVGCGIALCPYCRTPIDILSLQVDHKTPVKRGGSPGLDNQQPTCERCNKIKGELTAEEFAALVAFLDGPGASFRQRLEGIIINGYEGRMTKFFNRKGGTKPGKRVQGRMNFELGAF